MNNHRLLTGLLFAALLSGGVCAVGQSPQVLTLEQLFEIAETNSVQLRPSFTAEDEARREISVARSGRLPDISASLSLSYIGDGFTVKRDFSDYQKAPIPHFGNMLGVGATGIYLVFFTLIATEHVFEHTYAANILGFDETNLIDLNWYVFTDVNPAAHIPLGELCAMVQTQALVVSMKEIYGWLLIVAIISLFVILVSYGPLRPAAIFPKWKTIRRTFRRLMRAEEYASD